MTGSTNPVETSVDMQPKSLPTYQYSSSSYVTNSYIGKSVHLLLGQTTYVCTKLHARTSKNTVFLVTEFICNKTALFRIISMIITVEAYFGFVINRCEANRLKFGAPGWIIE